jgi:hypothetical protein
LHSSGDGKTGSDGVSSKVPSPLLHPTVNPNEVLPENVISDIIESMHDSEWQRMLRDANEEEE